MRVLILETDARAALAVELMLRSSRIGLDRAVSAEQAAVLDRQHRYDILLVDLAEPQAADQLLCRMRGIRLALPMLVLSQSDRPEACHAALAAGADGYIRKPFERRELLACVRRLLRPARRLKLLEGAAAGLVRRTAASPIVLAGRPGLTVPLADAAARETGPPP